MEFLKEWTFCICLSLIAAVIVSLFTPKGKMQRFYRLLIAFFVFTSFLYPFTGLSAERFSFDAWQFETPSVVENNAVYENAVNAQIKAVLEENGIIGASVQSELKADYQTGEITVKSVQIAVPDEADKSDVEQIVFDALGINARVIYLGE